MSDSEGEGSFRSVDSDAENVHQASDSEVGSYNNFN